MAILQAWARILTWDYREPIQLVIRAGLELGPPKYKSIATSFSNQEKRKRANSKERWGGKVMASRTMLFYGHAESLSARGEDQI